MVLLLLPFVLSGQGMGGGSKAVPRASPKASKKIPAPTIRFTDIAKTANVIGVNTYGGRDRKDYILEMTGSGVAIFDYDNDGRRDIFLVNGTRLDAGGSASAHHLYRNGGDGTFEDVSRQAGFGRPGWGQAVCAGDYDNDGDTDLFVTYYGHNVLYRNNGARFEDATAAAGLPVSGTRWNSGCAFLDYDRDGLLDIFAANYLAFNLEQARALGGSRFCSWKGLSVFCGPRGFPGGTNLLYRNQGDGRFSDVTDQAGIAVPGTHYGLGAVSSDFDDDGWPDIYVACDSTPSLLYHNNRDGTFTESAVPAGVAYGENGQEMGGMGVAAGDYDNDGLFDIVKTNFIDETSTLYRNRSELFFEDVSYESGLGVQTHFVSWGVVFFDLDHDGWKDIFIANGHIYPEVEGSKIGEQFAQRRILYWNLRNGAFRDVARGLGPELSKPQVSRGLAAGDLEGDGDLEFVVNNMNGVPSVLKNTGPKGNAILIEAEGSRSNRSAIGARIAVTAGGLRQLDEIRSGGSFFSQNDLRLHFGLGAASIIDRIEIRWPDGGLEVLEKVAANQSIWIREGEGIIKRVPFQRRGSS
ncbi:MAG: CRTAC1 family protein [Bryobacteraceae bacterium]